MPKTFVNPPTLFPSQQYGFSQIATSRGGTTVYLSGQVAWNPSQQIIGADDLGAQTRQALQNIETALQAVGGSRADVVSLRIYIVNAYMDQTAPVSESLRAFFDPERLPTSTWIGVTSLANPDFMIEIEAIAVVE